MNNNYDGNNNTDKSINNNDSDNDNITFLILVSKFFLHHTWKYSN